MWLGIFLHGHDAFASPGCLHQYAACSHFYSWTKIWYGVKVFVHGNNACAETPGLSIRITTFQAPNNHSQLHQRNEVMVRCFVCWSALLCKTLYPVGPPLPCSTRLKALCIATEWTNKFVDHCTNHRAWSFPVLWLSFVLFILGWYFT